MRTNRFSTRWSGVVAPQVQGEHSFYVSADAGAAFRLKVNGAVIVDNWANPATNAVPLAGTIWLGTNIAYDLKLEYAHFSNGAEVRLSWLEPGMTKEVIPPSGFQWDSSSGATGVSVDAAGKIWAVCFGSDTAVRVEWGRAPSPPGADLTGLKRVVAQA